MHAVFFTLKTILELLPDYDCLLAHHKMLPQVFYEVDSLKGQEVFAKYYCFFYLKFTKLGHMGLRELKGLILVLVILFLPFGIALLLL